MSKTIINIPKLCSNNTCLYDNRIYEFFYFQNLLIGETELFASEDD